MYPLVVKRGRDFHVAHLYRHAFASERSLDVPGCGFRLDVSRIEAKYILSVVGVKGLDRLFCKVDVSRRAAFRLKESFIGRSYSFLVGCLDLNVDVAQTLDGDGVVVLGIPFDAVVVLVSCKVAEMHVVGHIGIELLLLGLGRNVHVHHDFALDDHICAEARGIDPLLHVVGVKDVLSRSRVLYTEVALVVVAAYRPYRIFAVFQHIERESIVIACVVGASYGESAAFHSLERNRTGVEVVLLAVVCCVVVGCRLHYAAALRQVDDLPRFRAEFFQNLFGNVAFVISERGLEAGGDPDLDADLGVEALEHGLVGRRDGDAASVDGDSLVVGHHREESVAGGDFLVELGGEGEKFAFLGYHVELFRGDIDHIGIDVGNDVKVSVAQVRCLDAYGSVGVGIVFACLLVHAPAVLVWKDG